MLKGNSAAEAASFLESLSDADQLQRLFWKTDKLAPLLPAIKGCCSEVSQALKRVLASAFQTRTYPASLDTELANAAAVFQARCLKELMAAYGDQLLVLLSHPDVTPSTAKPTGADAEEWEAKL